MIIIAEDDKSKSSNLNNDTQSKKGPSTTFWAFLIGGFIICVLWLLLLTNLPAVMKIDDIPKFQNDIRNMVYLITIFYVIALIANFWLKSKYSEWNQQEGSSVKIMESHLLIPKIKDYAYHHYDLCLGNCIKIQGLMAYKEAGSVPTTRYFLFENIEYGEVSDYSIWVVNYVKVINIHLFKRIHIGRDSFNKYWTGERINEQHQSIADTTAGRKGKEIRNVSGDDEDSSSATEED